MLTKKILKNYLPFIFGGLIFTLALFLPSHLAPTCPGGRLQDKTLGGSCILFMDINKDCLCDYLNPPGELVSSQKIDLTNLSILFVFSLILIISIISFLATKDKKTLLFFRWLILIFSFVYFGIFFALRICPIGTLQAIFILKEAAILRIASFGVFFLVILSTIIFGRFFCGWLCPAGSLQELWSKIFEKIGLVPLKISKEVKQFLEIVPFLVLMIVIATILGRSQLVFCHFCPFASIFGKPINYFPLFFLFLLLLILPFIPRFFCRFICPLGAILKILGKYSIFQLKIDKKKCKNCRRCQKVCQIGAIEKKVSFHDCILCGNCLKECPKNAISYSAG